MKNGTQVLLTTKDIGNRMMVALVVGKIIYANESVMGGHMTATVIFIIMISIMDNVLVTSR